jgi:hypothetical protein
MLHGMIPTVLYCTEVNPVLPSGFSWCFPRNICRGSRGLNGMFAAGLIRWTHWTKRMKSGVNASNPVIGGLPKRFDLLLVGVCISEVLGFHLMRCPTLNRQIWAPHSGPLW